MKNVLLLVHDDPGQEARIQAAVDAVRALDGHLTCLHVTERPDRPFRTLAGPIATMVQEETAAIERLNAATIRPRLEAQQVPFDWIEENGDLTELVVERGRLADLIVISTVLAEVEFPAMAELARALARSLDTPILAVPPTAAGFEPQGAALVLWDGSSDAQAALRAAVPLLALASQVTIIQIDDIPHGLPLDEAADYLRKQGIVAHCKRREGFGWHPSFVIERYLERHAPAFVVMGAFGHGRVHDSLLGSVTSHLLATSGVPLLLASRP